MRVIYVAGPYRGKDEFAVWENVQKARKAAIELWKRGWAVICPHANTAHFEHFGRGLPDTTWLEGDLEIVSRCDAIFLVEGWEKSRGAAAEKVAAETLNLEVYERLEDVPHGGASYGRKV